MSHLTKGYLKKLLCTIVMVKQNPITHFTNIITLGVYDKSLRCIWPVL